MKWEPGRTPAGVILLSAVGSLYIVTSFYPLSYRIGAILMASSLLALTFWRPSAGIFLLFAIGPFFGNHPGGHFMELFPLLLLLWIGAALWYRPQLNTRFVLAGTPFVLAQFLPAVLHAWPSFDALHRYTDLFHILISDEHNPLYPVQQLLWMGALFLFASRIECAKSARTPSGEYARAAIAGIATGLALVLVIGAAETTFPVVARSLDGFHIRLDGYVDRTTSHFLSGWTSPNSLFWNRSWHGIYFISALPFACLALLDLLSRHRSNKAARPGIVALPVLLAGYVILLGARGTLLAFAVFAIALLPAAVMSLLRKEWARRLPLQHLLVAWPVVLAGLALLLHVALPILTVMGNLGLDEPRFAQYAAGLRIFLLFPVIGGGIESYGYYNTNALQGISMAAQNGTAHSQWLQILAGSGIIGGATYLALLVMALLGPLRSLQHACRQWKATAGKTTMEGTEWIAPNDAAYHLRPYLQPTIVLAGLAALLVYSTVQEWWYLKPVQAAWWLLIAVAVGMGPEATEGTSRTPASRFLRAIPLMLFLATVILAFLPVARLLAPSVPITHMTRQSVPGDAITINELPTIDAPDTGPMRWYGMEYQGGGRFLILEGTSWILLPASVTVVRFDGVEKMGMKHMPMALYAAKSARTESQDDDQSRSQNRLCDTGGVAACGMGSGMRSKGLFLHCSAPPGLNERPGDYDGRRLCAEMIVPDATQIGSGLFARPINAGPHRFR